jgi:hypothetical protein
LEQNINQHFQLCKFRMFKEQINGGLTECCDVTVDGVPWGSLNNAMRINAGLDCINVLSKHYDASLPIWIDNAESVIDLLETDAQQIRLVVADIGKMEITN